MMGDAGFKAAGTEGAADVHIETRPRTQLPELADLNPLIGVASHDQSICTGQISHFST
jgi:hypothetical protein